jgi:hypothetical protein
LIVSTEIIIRMKHAQEVQKVRARDAHPNMPSMSEQQMKDMLKAGVKIGIRRINAEKDEPGQLV